MKYKVLILGISSFAGSSFANYLLNKSTFKIFGTYNKKKKKKIDLFLKKKKIKKILIFFNKIFFWEKILLKNLN